MQLHKYTKMDSSLYTKFSRIMLLLCVFLLTNISFSQPMAPGEGNVNDTEASLENNYWLFLIIFFAISWGIKKTHFFHQKQDG